MTSVRRLVVDVLDLENDPLPGVFVHVNEEDIYDMHVVIVGPEGTPYEGGFHFFHLRFMPRYPYVPPTVLYLSTNGRIRMNPNLYENGKVCLSILGTWDGPGWTSVMNLRSLILSLQSILGECPLHNEPSFSREPRESMRCRNYNTIVSHYNRVLGIINALECPPVPHFREQILAHVVANREGVYDRIIERTRAEIGATTSAFVVANYGLRVTTEDKARVVDRMEEALAKAYSGAP